MRTPNDLESSNRGEETERPECVSKKRTRTVMSPAQNSLLMEVFLVNPFPGADARKGLAKSLGIKPRTVQIWFQNQRQKSRGKKCEAPHSGIGPVYSDFPIPNLYLAKSRLEVLADVAYSEYCKLYKEKETTGAKRTLHK